MPVNWAIPSKVVIMMTYDLYVPFVMTAALHDAMSLVDWRSVWLYLGCTILLLRIRYRGLFGPDI